jgi:hypothetical protein
MPWSRVAGKRECGRQPILPTPGNGPLATNRGVDAIGVMKKSNK